VWLDLENDFILDVLVCICFLVWDENYMYSDIRLVCIAFYEMSCIWSECIHEFPKGLECHVCMRVRAMTLSRFHEMTYVWSACNTWVSQRFGVSCMYVRLRYDIDWIGWNVVYLECMYIRILQRFGMSYVHVQLSYNNVWFIEM
jgi:hypothetical protein